MFVKSRNRYYHCRNDGFINPFIYFIGLKDAPFFGEYESY